MAGNVWTERWKENARGSTAKMFRNRFPNRLYEEKKEKEKILTKWE